MLEGAEGADGNSSPGHRVHVSTADMRYFVLPLRPEGTEGWSEEQLAEIVTRDCMIGTAIPEAPGTPVAAA